MLNKAESVNKKQILYNEGEKVANSLRNNTCYKDLHEHWGKFSWISSIDFRVAIDLPNKGLLDLCIWESFLRRTVYLVKRMW